MEDMLFQSASPSFTMAFKEGKYLYLTLVVLAFLCFLYGYFGSDPTSIAQQMSWFIGAAFLMIVAINVHQSSTLQVSYVLTNGGVRINDEREDDGTVTIPYKSIKAIDIISDPTEFKNRTKDKEVSDNSSINGRTDSVLIHTDILDGDRATTYVVSPKDRGNFVSALRKITGL